MTHRCALRVQKWTVGRNHAVSSSVPARSLKTVPGGAVPGFASLQTQVPHAAQIHRVTVRPLSAMRWKDRVSPPVKRHASALTTRADEKALLVSF
jgi:hypothetical protein